MKPFSSRGQFVQLEDTFENPTMALFGMRRSGIAISCMYKFGSRKGAYSAMNVSCLKLQWFGIRPSEIGLIKKRPVMEMTARDKRMILSFLDE
jgi:DNA topoisomerase VI subunit A